MDAGLKVCLDKHHEAAEALAEHFAQKNDDAGFELLDELLEYQIMSIRVLNDAWRNVKGKA
jgi:hypothetical protein